MESFWNNRWARVAALSIVGGGYQLGTVPA